MVGVMEAVRVGEMGVGAAEFAGADGHLLGELCHGSCVISAEGVGDIVRAFEHEAVEHLHSRDLLVGFDGKAAFSDGSVFILDDDVCVQVTGFDDEKSGHHLGGTCGVKGFVRIFFKHHFSGAGVDADGASRGEAERVSGRFWGEGGGLRGFCGGRCDRLGGNGPLGRSGLFLFRWLRGLR